MKLHSHRLTYLKLAFLPAQVPLPSSCASPPVQHGGDTVVCISIAITITIAIGADTAIATAIAAAIAIATTDGSHKRAVTFIPMPMPTTICRTDVYNN